MSGLLLTWIIGYEGLLICISQRYRVYVGGVVQSAWRSIGVPFVIAARRAVVRLAHFNQNVFCRFILRYLRSKMDGWYRGEDPISYQFLNRTFGVTPPWYAIWMRFYYFRKPHLSYVHPQYTIAEMSQNPNQWAQTCICTMRGIISLHFTLHVPLY